MFSAQKHIELSRTITDKLTQEEQRILLEEIAQVSEASFRRGFQHGYLITENESFTENHEPTAQQVFDWRFKKEEYDGYFVYKSSTCPPGPEYEGQKDSLTTRLSWEVRNVPFTASIYAMVQESDSKK